MKYKLNSASSHAQEKTSLLDAVKKLGPLVAEERNIIFIALGAVILNSALTLSVPRLIAHALDTFIPAQDYVGLLSYAGIILGMYAFGLGTSYAQTRLMGGVGQRVLFRLRNAVFTKLQELPLAFFAQNKAGDLISRINNDTDKINQFFSQSLVQFMGSVFLMIGSAIFLVSIHVRLGSATLVPAILLFLFTQLLSPWVKRKNFMSMQTLGGLSSEIQESLSNFKAIIIFNRRGYFKERFTKVNEENYQASVWSGFANNVFTPVYGFASSMGQLVVLVYGIHLISVGAFTVGLLLSFLMYVNNFYSPLRQIAALWSNFQSAMASWDRVHEILVLDTDLEVISDAQTLSSSSLITFSDVHFSYPDGKEVLHGISLELARGKTYALVGPTGGGKTTTASLMARLYDATTGTVFFDGKDIRAYTPEERAQKIGVILQDPFLFTGTVRENIVYGNAEYGAASSEELVEILRASSLEGLIARFDGGLETKITASGESMSLGQKQLIAFMRAVLRKPELLILDEATANVDTVTEGLLEEILTKLPSTTTKVIIAHRLNTIANADEIFFVHAGDVVKAGSLDDAVHMLLRNKRTS